MKDFINKHKELVTVGSLGVIFYFLFFHNLWAYPLLDVDETRYVDMARVMHQTKDYLTLYLNGEFFFEKPPLYFWILNASFELFNQVSTFAARFPIALCTTITGFMLYFCGRKTVSRKFGIMSSLIYATSLEVLILSKVAMLDMVITSFILLSLYSGFMTFFVGEKNKKYFWWLFYIFSALAVLSKGIPGFIVPFGTMFFAGIVSKQIKEYFKPQYFLVGFLLFFAISVPWHVVMFNMHNPLFYNEYIIKHHLARFSGGNELGRSHGAWYYFVTLLWGFFPWIFSFVSMLCENSKKISKDMFKSFNFSELNSVQKYTVLNIIGALFIMLFFTSSDTKLVTYILPIYAPLACLVAHYWIEYIEGDKHQKPINLSVMIFNSILVLASFIAIFSNFFLPEMLTQDIAGAKWFTIGLLMLVPLFGIISVRKNNKLNVFISYVLFVVLLSAFGTPKFFNIDYKFGQNDLMKYASYAKENKYELGSYNTARKYSLMFYSNSTVDFCLTPDFEWLKNKLKDKNSVVVLRIKEEPNIDKTIKYDTIFKDRKYMLIRGK